MSRLVIPGDSITGSLVIGQSLSEILVLSANRGEGVAPHC